MARAVVAAALLGLAAAPATAQRSQPAQEFTRQGLLVVNFESGPGADAALGDRIAELLRDRLDRALNKREVDVTQTGEIRHKLQLAGFEARGVLPLATIEQLGRLFRVDELLFGRVERGPNGVRVAAQLVLMRDRRMRQPLATVEARTPEAAVDALARALAAARAQLPHQRRCENFLREGKNNDALRAAREGIAAYSGGSLARICQVQALRNGLASATDVLSAARELLAADSMSHHGLEAAGIALDSLRRRPEAATMWLRLASTDSANLELTERVLWALHENENSRPAEPLAVRVSDAHPDSTRLLHLKWRITHANGSWAKAVEAGEALLERDSIVATDSGFVVRLVTAYQGNAQPYHALATAARGVATIPSARLYALYAELVRAESDTVLPRGLALYPKSADLLALNAKTLRSQGKIAEALEVTRLAVAIDPTLPDGQLSIAQAEFDLGQPDSALATLRRIVERPRDEPVGGMRPVAATSGEPSGMTPSAGDAPPTWSASLGPAMAGPAAAPAVAWTPPSDSLVTVIAQFSLAKGNTLLRAANATKTLDGFGLALRFLTLGDSLRPSVQGAFLRSVAALGVASAAVTESVNVPPSSGGCALLRTAAEQLPVARAGLEQGRDIAAEAADQYLGFLGQLEPFVQRQLDGACGGAASPAPLAAAPPPPAASP